LPAEYGAMQLAGGGEIAADPEALARVVLTPIDQAGQAANRSGSPIGVACDEFPSGSGRLSRLSVHIGVDEMDECPVVDIVHYLIAIGASTGVLVTPHQIHLIAELTDHSRL
jgi:hypothetical protein